MRVLILGGDGMLGHQLLLSFQSKFKVKVTLRLNQSEYNRFGIFNPQNSYYNIDVKNIEKIKEVVNSFKPNVIINAIGIVKQREEAKNIIESIEINSLFPHKLSILCQENDIKLIHISTDCVFSGRTGMYTESSNSDAEDIYGKSKYFGEVTSKNCLTLRTSIIGRALNRHNNLLDWFFNQKNQIFGYKNAVFSGLTTLELSNVIEIIISKFPEAHGLYHVSSKPITKLDLLKLISEKFNHEIKIIPETSTKCDRSLCSDLFTKEFRYIAPSWEAMITDLKNNSINHYNLYQNV